MRPIAAVGAVLVMLGFICFGCSSKSKRELAEYGANPERISLESLIQRGRGGPRNVIVTDYRLCRNYVIHETIDESNRLKPEIRWLHAYIPIVPPAKPGDHPAAALEPVKVRVVIHCQSARDEAELSRRCGGPELQGLVVGTVKDLDPKDQQLIREAYPGTDPSDCTVITEGATVEAVRNPTLVRDIGLGLMVCGGLVVIVAIVVQSERGAVTIEEASAAPRASADAPPHPPSERPSGGSPPEPADGRLGPPYDDRNEEHRRPPDHLPGP